MRSNRRIKSIEVKTQKGKKTAMQFPQDAGLSCIRYYLTNRDELLEEAARSELQSPARCVGTMVCQCGADSAWGVLRPVDPRFVVLECGCNGSSIPVYIGQPPFGPLSDRFATDELPPCTADACACGERFKNRLAIGIGYAKTVPPLGTLDVERAQEVVVLSRCLACGRVGVRWRRQLARPPLIVGDEPWIRIIQGFQFGKAGASPRYQ
jgi:hypothetical protein